MNRTAHFPTLFSVFLTVALVLSLPLVAWAQARDTLPSSTRLSMPGEQHRWLEPLTGKWDVQMRVWPAAGAQPVTSTELAATREWILGGRYLREELTGRFADQPSTRVGLLSYNNLEQRFEFLTADTFEPGQMWYASQGMDSARQISLRGESTEAGYGPQPTGRKRALRLEMEISEGRNVQRIYVKYPGEAEFMFVEQIFVRKPQ